MVTASYNITCNCVFGLGTYNADLCCGCLCSKHIVTTKPGSISGPANKDIAPLLFRIGKPGENVFLKSIEVRVSTIRHIPPLEHLGYPEINSMVFKLIRQGSCKGFHITIYILPHIVIAGSLNETALFN